ERQCDEDPDLRRDLEIVAVEVADGRHQRQEADRDQAPAYWLRQARLEDVEQRALEEQEDEDGARERGDGEGGQPDQRHRDQRSDHARSRTTSPRSPLGRKMRIRISIEKARMSLYSAPKAPPVSNERYAAANASSRPRTSPPTIAPGMLPIPPSTAAVNAFSP